MKKVSPLHPPGLLLGPNRSVEKGDVYDPFVTSPLKGKTISSIKKSLTFFTNSPSAQFLNKTQEMVAERKEMEKRKE